jgi:hypothetical protein
VAGLAQALLEPRDALFERGETRTEIALRHRGVGRRRDRTLDRSTEQLGVADLFLARPTGQSADELAAEEPFERLLDVRE